MIIFSLFEIKILMNVHKEIPSVRRRHIVLIYQVPTTATARKALVEMASTVLVSYLYDLLLFTSVVWLTILRMPVPKYFQD